jgi:hypothetical protein
MTMCDNCIGVQYQITNDYKDSWLSFIFLKMFKFLREKKLVYEKKPNFMALNKVHISIPLSFYGSNKAKNKKCNQLETSYKLG